MFVVVHFAVVVVAVVVVVVLGFPRSEIFVECFVLRLIGHICLFLLHLLFGQLRILLVGTLSGYLSLVSHRLVGLHRDDVQITGGTVIAILSTVILHRF